MPSETRAFYDRLRKKGGFFKYGNNIFSDDNLLQILKDILDKHPEYYLDQFVEALYRKSNVLVSPSTVYRCLHDQLNYRMLAVQEIALQRNEEDRELFKEALLAIVEHPEMLILVDETHKDKNASRKRRAWGRRGVNLELSRWFEDTVRYTLIGVADFNGFVAESCCLVRRDVAEAEFTTMEGSAGTVTQERFLKFVKDDLCPVLGNFELCEKRSIVLMDNATVHMLPEVKEAIHACGAYLMYTAPYSPDLNPIEKMFSVYKAMLKRNEELDWMSRHDIALSSITPSIAHKEFKKCGIPLCGVVVQDDIEDDDLIVICAGISILVNYNLL